MCSSSHSAFVFHNVLTIKPTFELFPLLSSTPSALKKCRNHYCTATDTFTCECFTFKLIAFWKLQHSSLRRHCFTPLPPPSPSPPPLNWSEIKRYLMAKHLVYCIDPSQCIVYWWNRPSSFMNEFMSILIAWIRWLHLCSSPILKPKGIIKTKRWASLRILGKRGAGGRRGLEGRQEAPFCKFK